MKEGKRPEEKVRERLLGFRRTLFLRFGEKKAKLILWAIPLALLVLVGLLVAMLLFPVRSFEISGEVQMFNESEIIAAAELEAGDSLFFNTSGSIERRIKRNLPLCEDVKVRKNLGGKVKIEVAFADVHFYAKMGERYAAIDSDLRVLDLSETGSKYAAFGAAYVKLPEVREPELGERIVFFDTVEETDTEGETIYEVKEEDFYSFASEFLAALEDSGFLADTDVVELSEKFNVRMVYAGKFLVRFGRAEELGTKFKVLFGILEEGSLQYAEYAIVELSDPGKAMARPVSELDFSEYFE